MLPFGIQINDDLNTLDRKIGKKATFIDKDSPYILYWNDEDIGFLRIQCDESSYIGIWGIVAKPFIAFEKRFRVARTDAESRV